MFSLSHTHTHIHTHRDINEDIFVKKKKKEITYLSKSQLIENELLSLTRLIYKKTDNVLPIHQTSKLSFFIFNGRKKQQEKKF